MRYNICSTSLTLIQNENQKKWVLNTNSVVGYIKIRDSNQSNYENYESIISLSNYHSCIILR